MRWMMWCDVRWCEDGGPVIGHGALLRAFSFARPRRGSGYVQGIYPQTAGDLGFVVQFNLIINRKKQKKRIHRKRSWLQWRSEIRHYNPLQKNKPSFVNLLRIHAPAKVFNELLIYGHQVPMYRCCITTSPTQQRSFRHHSHARSSTTLRPHPV